MVKRKLISGDEHDVVEPRRLYCWTQRAGATAEVKRRIRRRERREGRREARQQD